MSSQTQAPGSRFEFVAVASQRARQLLQGCTPRIEQSHKVARTARREVEAGTVVKESGAGLAPPKGKQD